MTSSCPLTPGITCEVEALKFRLAEAEAELADARDLIRAIQSGEVDALVVSGAQGDRVFTLQGAEYAYRALVEAMNEGAATLGADGIVLYCNQQLSSLLEIPIEQIIGQRASRLFPESIQQLNAMFDRAAQGLASKAKMDLRVAGKAEVPVQVSISRISPEQSDNLSMVVTDLTETKKSGDLIAQGRLANSILDSAAEAIAVCDETGRIIRCNRALEMLCGFNPLSYPFEEALPLLVDESGTATGFSISKAIHGKIQNGQELTFRRKDGRQAALLLGSGLIAGPAGVIGCVLTLTDITTRRRLEREKQEARQLAQSTIDALSSSICVIDEAGLIVGVNKEWRRFAAHNSVTGPGLSPYEGLCEGVNYIDVCERAAAFGETNAAQFVVGLVDVLTGKVDVYSQEYPCDAPDEKRRFIARITRFGSGHLRRAVVEHINISERREAEEALRLSTERFELALKGSSVVVFNQDLDLQYTWIYNPALGYRTEQVMGKRDTEIFECLEDAAATEAIKVEVIRTGEGQRREVLIRWQGVPRYYDLLVEPLTNPDGVIVGVTCAAIDITERKLAEQAILASERAALQNVQLRALAERLQQAREEQRKEVARDLHDRIGQILTAIKMDIAWVARHMPEGQVDLSCKLSGTIDLIDEGARSVRRICSGLRPPLLDDMGLAAAIEWEAKESTNRSGISCALSLPESKLRIDPDRSTALFRIFQECLTNVLKHAEARGISVTLKEEGGVAILIVRDDGKGFRESDHSNARGSLGLLGIRERVQGCGGEVTVSSSPGTGTCVTVRVPLSKTGEEVARL